MGVGWGYNLFKQHRCSRRECVSAALHPVVGSQMRHEPITFVAGVEGVIMDTSECLQFLQQSSAKFCSQCCGVTLHCNSGFTVRQQTSNLIYVEMTLPVSDLTFS